MSTDHNFLREKRAKAESNGGPSVYQPNTLLLGQTGSLWISPGEVEYGCREVEFFALILETV